MAPNKSLDDNKIIVHLLHDVYNRHGAVFNSSSRRNTTKKVLHRLKLEGMSFLTKTLRSLGKGLDKALAGDTPLIAADYRLASMENSKLPKLFGELFSRVLTVDGVLLPNPCTISVRSLRQLLFAFSKYELPYSDEQEQKVISAFERTEDDLVPVSRKLDFVSALVDHAGQVQSRHRREKDMVSTARRARRLLSSLFAHFDPRDIYPRHGPGAVSDKRQHSEKYLWTYALPDRVTDSYPIDAYFYASLGHYCDESRRLLYMPVRDPSARVILVPKDSRGPRLISCEATPFQWLQQGLGQAIVDLCESHRLTRDNVRFTDQEPNRIGALYGSYSARYATLDLKEASDRISLSLVHLLFPPHIVCYLEACRSLSTELPNGKVLTLRKFAPMGSSLCFPIMALSVWAILAAAAPDADTRKSIYVYGDDVIVPTAFAEDAIEQLESFGLKANHDKCCIKGLFRESCGMDAFNGANVTPVKFKTVWSSSRSPDSYVSWVSYANSLYVLGYYDTYDYIVSGLLDLYGQVPGRGQVGLTCPSLIETPLHMSPLPRRRNHELQVLEHRVWVVETRAHDEQVDGWSMLLRYFAEHANRLNRDKHPEKDLVTRITDEQHKMLSEGASQLEATKDASWLFKPQERFDVRSYTRRRASMLVRRWR